MPADQIRREVERYYSAKVAEHGPTPPGVDWNSEESQVLRFEQLLSLHRHGSDAFSLNDYGCGYGALAGWLGSRYDNFTYVGFDISTAMIDQARRLLGEDSRASFVSRDEDLEPADYTVASGIFNVKQQTAEDRWREYVLQTIDRLWELSEHGLALNMLTSYSDPELTREDLFYGDPMFFFDHCKRRLSRHVSLLHDYGLYEFTLIVRRGQA